MATPRSMAGEKIQNENDGRTDTPTGTQTVGPGRKDTLTLYAFPVLVPVSYKS